MRAFVTWAMKMEGTIVRWVKGLGEVVPKYFFDEAVDGII